MTASPVRKIEIYLYGKGFSDPVLRSAMLVQILLAVAAFVCGLALVWLSYWPLMFALGVACIVFNFWFLCRFVFKYFSGVFSRELLVGHLFGFFVRLLLTGLVLGAAFILGGSPVAASAGIFTSVGLCAAVALLRSRANK